MKRFEYVCTTATKPLYCYEAAFEGDRRLAVAVDSASLDGRIRGPVTGRTDAWRRIEALLLAVRIPGDWSCQLFIDGTKSCWERRYRHDGKRLHLISDRTIS